MSKLKRYRENKRGDIVNKVKIFKNGKKCELYLNGINIPKILDFSYKKSSAVDRTELTVRFVADEITEIFK